MGKPGFPIPLLEGCALTLPRAGAWGNEVSPSLPSPPPLEEGTRLVSVHISLGSAGIMVFEKFIRYIGLAVGLKPSATGCEARLRGLYRIMYSKTILPAEMRQGQGALTPRRVGYPRCEQLPRLLPPAGGGWEGGRAWRAIVTSAIHAAPPRTDGMNILPGRAQPSQTLPRAGPGCAGLRPASAEVWGNPVSPCPSPRAYMVFEKLIRSASLAVGLTPSATGCKARLRGLYRIIFSKTIFSR